MKKMEDLNNPTMRETVNYDPKEDSNYKRGKMLVLYSENSDEDMKQPISK